MSGSRLGIRRALSRALQPDADAERDALARRLDDIERRLAALEAPRASPDDAVAKLDKRVSMTMGAVQASTTQLAALREAVAQARAEASQASQKAAAALATAESAAEGVTALEDARS